MEKCPYCGRKIGDITPGVEFIMPEHENYNKTDKCEASGKSFVNTGGVHSTEPVRSPRIGMAILAALSLWIADHPVHPAYAGRPPRRWR